MISFLTRKLASNVAAGDSVFAYCSSSFAPALDESLGDLSVCFGGGSGEIEVNYCITRAYG